MPSPTVPDVGPMFVVSELALSVLFVAVPLFVPVS
jgi:hypothetical protein